MSDAAARANAGRGWGVMALTGFGALWLYNAAINSPIPHVSAYVVLAIAAAMIAGGLLLVVRTPKVEESEPDKAESHRFWLVFGAEGAAIFAVIVLFQLWHLVEYIVTAVAVIVGIHFLPLASLFRAPTYYLAGTALIAVPLALVFVFRGAPLIVDTAWAAGVILWVTALHSLLVKRN